MKKDFLWIDDVDDVALIAVVPRLKDWEILKKEGWYRIPVDKAPKIIDRVKYLAFYQPGIFGDEKYSVNYYAKVKNREIKKRIELLPDELGDSSAQRLYYKFTIGRLMKLPHPIMSKKWRRIVFIPTAKEILFVAKEINDLYRLSPIEERLYRLMKENGLSPERQFFVKVKGNYYALDFAIFCKNGKIDIESDGKRFHSGESVHNKDRKRNNALASDGWVVLRFWGREIMRNGKSCVNLIKNTVKTLGGESPKT